jgi:hypothetical protein
MLEHAAEPLDGREGRGERAAVVAEERAAGATVGRGLGVAPPGGARRVSDDRVGAGVGAGVPRLAPGVYALDVGVAAAWLDIEGRDHRAPHNARTLAR